MARSLRHPRSIESKLDIKLEIDLRAYARAAENLVECSSIRWLGQAERFEGARKPACVCAGSVLEIV
jgi:hypothetical protein